MKFLVATSLFALGVYAQAKCKGVGAGRSTSVAKGFTSYLIQSGLANPRGIAFDTEGNLLVVEKTTAGQVTALKLKEDGGCVSVASKASTGATSPVTGFGGQLNHGISLSPDGKTLYASSLEAVYSWPYNAKEAKVGARSTLITGMTKGKGLVPRHFTRTLLALKKPAGILLVSLGSTDNDDPLARTQNTGVSQIRGFNATGARTVKYTDGKLIGWGLRNSIGLGENPVDGGIWSNENGADQMTRSGKDIHINSPGEEFNYHGTWADETLHGKNYGYPECAASWSVSEMPNSASLKVGAQFIYGNTAKGITDDICAKNYVAPRITLPSHWAPIDIAFTPKGHIAFQTAHGSWNRRPSDGFKLYAVTFKDGQPTHETSSLKAAIDIFTSNNTGKCSALAGGSCLRPTGVAIDPKGARLFMASDNSASGEIYVIQRTDGKSIDSLTVEEVEALQHSTPPRRR